MWEVKIIFGAMIAILIYMCGYNQGFNSGHETAIKFAPECQSYNK